jgi:hypothetical protein
LEPSRCQSSPTNWGHSLSGGWSGLLIEEVLPLDDADRLDQAKPITPDGKVTFDPKRVAARQDGTVKAATARGSLALIVLGASHDLSDSVRRVGGGRCEYVRVTTRRYREFSEVSGQSLRSWPLTAGGGPRTGLREVPALAPASRSLGG